MIAITLDDVESSPPTQCNEFLGKETSHSHILGTKDVASPSVRQEEVQRLRVRPIFARHVNLDTPIFRRHKGLVWVWLVERTCQLVDCRVKNINDQLSLRKEVCPCALKECQK